MTDSQNLGSIQVTRGTSLTLSPLAKKIFAKMKKLKEQKDANANLDKPAA